jgi:hypothetical protein
VSLPALNMIFVASPLSKGVYGWGRDTIQYFDKRHRAGQAESAWCKSNSAACQNKHAQERANRAKVSRRGKFLALFPDPSGLSPLS